MKGINFFELLRIADLKLDHGQITIGEYEKMIAPLKDAVLVVRCKDCKNWDRTWKSGRPNYHYCPITDGIHNGFWYCADGDRRGICNE